MGRRTLVTWIGQAAEEQGAHGDTAVLVGSERAGAEHLDGVVDAFRIRARGRVAAGGLVEPRRDDVVLRPAAEEPQDAWIVGRLVCDPLSGRHVAADRAQHPMIVVGEGECGAPHPVAHAEPLEGHCLPALGAYRELRNRWPLVWPLLDRALGEKIGEPAPEKRVVERVEEGRRVHEARRRGPPDLAMQGG